LYRPRLTAPFEEEFFMFASKGAPISNVEDSPSKPRILNEKEDLEIDPCFWNYFTNRGPTVIYLSGIIMN
jgi:hypothetical protein